MRLLKLRIKNFRGIGSGENGSGLEVTLDKQDIIFLIGKIILENHLFFMPMIISFKIRNLQ